MAVIYFAAQTCDQRSRPLNVAALTAAILFCSAPLQIVDAGFALTFGATLGILAGVSRMAGMLPASVWLRAPATLLVASASAEVALLPVNAFVFSRVTAAGLIVNFAAIPMMTTCCEWRGTLTERCRNCCTRLRPLRDQTSLFWRRSTLPMSTIA